MGTREATQEPPFGKPL